jgi:hypothetical protein
MKPPLVVIGNRVMIPYLHDKGHLTFQLGVPKYEDQVFSYQRKHDDGTPEGDMLHIHIAKLHRLIAADPESYGTVIVNVNRAQARFLIDNNGIEMPYLSRMPHDFLDKPGILLMWPGDFQTIIDGNHRYVKRAMLRLTEMKFWTVTPEQIKPALLDFPDELAPV